MRQQEGLAPHHPVALPIPDSWGGAGGGGGVWGSPQLPMVCQARALVGAGGGEAPSAPHQCLSPRGEEAGAFGATLSAPDQASVRSQAWLLCSLSRLHSSWPSRQLAGGLPLGACGAWVQECPDLGTWKLCCTLAAAASGVRESRRPRRDGQPLLQLQGKAGSGGKVGLTAARHQALLCPGWSLGPQPGRDILWCHPQAPTSLRGKKAHHSGSLQSLGRGPSGPCTGSHLCSQKP